MLRRACSLLEENFGHDMVGEASPSGFAVREFLNLDWSFKAFWGEMPIATEVRVFIRDGNLECIHQYWPEVAISKWAGRNEGAIPDNWRDILAEHGAKIEHGIETIRRQAKEVARVMDGWWSCDMALGRDLSTWYLIDMAPGAASYHLPSCEHAPEQD